MRFGSLLVAGFAALAAAIPANKVVENIRMVTSQSQQLLTPAKNLVLLDGPLLVTGQGNFPPIIAGFQQIVTTATAAINQMNPPEKYSGQGADEIFDAFRTFVMVHQELLNVLIGKAGLFNTIPFIGQPVAAVLRAVESVVDTIAFSLIDSIESRAADLTKEADSLSSTIGTAIDTYSGLSL
ncbi:hypothetical protein N3K66_007205 [Trichothecium roseum]|uniref:Uncharacterized protein n=1 Tax=Trichothecium roseum TaxID=47278 RepID=A0ACC0UT85_9HYPO|nr:hypothetical protein N3K66_007205 [Trichothecium roseum]